MIMNQAQLETQATNIRSRHSLRAQEQPHDVLSAAMTQVESMAELCEAAAGCFADEFESTYLCVRILNGKHQAVSAVGLAEWSPLAQGVLARTAETGKPLVRLLESAGGANHAVVGVPISTVAAGTGALVAILESTSLSEARERLQDLIGFARLFAVAADGLCGRLRHRDTTSSHLSVLARSVSYDSVTQYCYAIANGLRVELDADLVAVGLVHRQSVRLSCISGLDEFDSDSPGSRLICESMEEALDAGRPICVQGQHATELALHSDGHPLTRQWQQSVSGVTVASVPVLNNAGTCIAVISVQGHSGHSLTSKQLQTITGLTDSLVAALELMKSGYRSLPRHALDAAANCKRAVLGRLRVKSVVGLAGISAVICWMAFGVTDYVVRTPCTIVAAHTRQLTTPGDAVLSQVLGRPGAIVEKGQLLAVLDTRSLEEERERVEAELRAANIQVVTAAREGIPALIGRAVSRREIAEAELKRISRQLVQSQVLAPFRGQIISDDISQRTGELLPMGEPLFEIVPDGDLAVQLELPESILAFVQSGQRGSFSLNAHPGSAQECRVSRIEPAVAPGASGNVVTGLANIQAQPAWLRPGMQGVVLINTGERPVWWTWLHKAVEFMSYEMWSLSGSVGITSSQAVSTSSHIQHVSWNE